MLCKKFIQIPYLNLSIKFSYILLDKIILFYIAKPDIL